MAEPATNTLTLGFYPVSKRFIEGFGIPAAYEQGPYGSGKSVAGCAKLYFWGQRRFRINEQTILGLYDVGTAEYELCKAVAVMYKHGVPSKSAIIRDTLKSLKETTWRSFIEIFGHLGTWAETKNTFTIYSEHGITHEFLFLGLDKPADVKKAKSLEVTDFLIDEASEVSHDIFLALQGRKGRHPKIENKAQIPKLMQLIDPLALLVSNPPEDEHWLVEDFETNPKAGYVQYLQPSGLSAGAENIIHLEAGYYDRLLEQYASRPDLIARYVHGRRAVIVRGKAVYQQEFDKAFHVITDPEACPVWPGKAFPILNGHDNSGNVPAACCGWRNPNGQIVIRKEFVTDKSGILDFMGRMIEWQEIEYKDAKHIDISDPAGHAEFSDSRGGMTSNAALVEEKHGRVMVKGPVKFSYRREALSEKLRARVDNQPAIIIYGPDCPRLVAGLEGGYAYPQLPDNRGYGPEPIKNKYSHPVESCQYLMTYLVQPEDSEQSDEVARVIAAQMRKPAGVFR